MNFTRKVCQPLKKLLLVRRCQHLWVMAFLRLWWKTFSLSSMVIAVRLIFPSLGVEAQILDMDMEAQLKTWLWQKRNSNSWLTVCGKFMNTHLQVLISQIMPFHLFVSLFVNSFVLARRARSGQHFPVQSLILLFKTATSVRERSMWRKVMRSLLSIVSTILFWGWKVAISWSFHSRLSQIPSKQSLRLHKNVPCLWGSKCWNSKATFGQMMRFVGICGGFKVCRWNVPSCLSILSFFMVGWKHWMWTTFPSGCSVMLNLGRLSSQLLTRMSIGFPSSWTVAQAPFRFRLGTFHMRIIRVYRNFVSSLQWWQTLTWHQSCNTPVSLLVTGCVVQQALHTWNICWVVHSFLTCRMFWRACIITTGFCFLRGSVQRRRFVSHGFGELAVTRLLTKS